GAGAGVPDRVGLPRGDDLGLAGQAAQRRGVQHTRPVTLEGGTPGALVGLGGPALDGRRVVSGGRGVVLVRGARGGGVGGGAFDGPTVVAGTAEGGGGGGLGWGRRPARGAGPRRGPRPPGAPGAGGGGSRGAGAGRQRRPGPGGAREVERGGETRAGGRRARRTAHRQGASRAAPRAGRKGGCAPERGADGAGTVRGRGPCGAVTVRGRGPCRAWDRAKRPVGTTTAGLRERAARFRPVRVS